MVPEKYFFGGELVNTYKTYTRECPKIGLLQYMGMFEFTGIYTAYIAQRTQIKTKYSITSPVSCCFVMPKYQRAAGACISFTFH